MEDSITTEPKTKTLGTISADKTKKIVGWTDYEKAAKALVEARRAAQAAKSKVKDAMKKTMGEDDRITF